MEFASAIAFSNPISFDRNFQIPINEENIITAVVKILFKLLVVEKNDLIYIGMLW